jgi:putative spermidine/putrescine transport system ATP-binding protein
MADVQLSSISKQYGSMHAVKDITFHIREGELLSLLGPSGCGKTTLLRMIAGFIQPTSGEIYVGGKRIDQVPPYRRDIGMVFQSYALFPHMTVAENVEFGLKMRKTSPAVAKQRIAEALAMVKLSGLETRLPRELSGGQQQRVAVARALAIRPKVLLLDEPLSNLDAKLRVETRVELRRIQKETNITTIFVTHDQEEALIVSDRIAVMRSGVIEQAGMPNEIYDQPATRFVADFIGRTNFLQGDIKDGKFIAKGGTVIPVNQPDQADVTVSLRPERLRLSNLPADNLVNLQGQIQSIIYMGPNREFTLSVGSDTYCVIVANYGNVEHALAEGDQVLIQIDPADCRILMKGC